ncbi:V-type ATPase, D subunit [Methanospirillum hungatei JF-1]|jgi:V/A-type H+-transporting ATPase subunit D|uniref:A-type ATP synthase subunit D n=1 Tax=Methanospirillum hungatei JF-1 (strain ATCC 27890 / DSM 864 / NBRC 100397 / JF-1) TaxID=323259 RepID=Q2FP50_METHJ|nr:V-type ATP synthase subunit D [Methanospirillum hungatei]MBP7035068.1 V-type ATP synthase subunit D [Methanospirillum sp.]ABD40933.1 V-type ATPase, D subunit [Methanospirillum hungatei JF-1]MBP9007802.1 V-type ATP synthase subunit D [Methanospirillum sp.]MCA1916304.1 V-type ATP synthase subunit D [Methanospirillum hungatei]HOW05708.1 V-type ATP synthase subunit D [Methanospirillum hungatei]
MALKDVKPTRSELINIKKKIKLSQNGYKILKMKRDGLIMEFFKVLEEAKDSRGALLEKYARAQEMMAIANTIEGSIGVKAAAFSVRENPDITLKSKNIMGVVVPEIESTKVRKGIADRGYGVIGTTPVIDDTAAAFEDLVEAIIKSAEIETTMKRLLDEIESTKRRVNALEFKVIPELSDARDFIKMRLDEMEREELFRLKKIKARSTA